MHRANSLHGCVKNYASQMPKCIKTISVTDIRETDRERGRNEELGKVWSIQDKRCSGL